MLNFFVASLQKLNWSMRYKIGLAFSLVLICFVLNGVISLVLLYTIKHAEEQQISNALYLERLQGWEKDYKNGLDIYYEAIFYTKVNTIRDDFSVPIVGALVQDREEHPNNPNRSFEDKFLKLYDTILRDFTDLKISVRQNDFATAISQWQKYTPDFKAITDLLASQRQSLEAARDQGQQEMVGTIFLSSILIVSLTLFSLILALFLLILIERVLVRPLNILQRGLKKVAEGELDQHVEIINRDEIGKLAQSFKLAMLSLQQVISGVQISESLRTVTSQLTSVSKQQAAGSTEQVSALSQVMSAMEEMGRTAGYIAENAVQVDDLTNKTLEQIERVAASGSNSQERAHQMVAVVERTLSGVERVGSRVAEFSRSMNQLNEQVEAIGKVVGLLGSIADEVHLLALNAAIEAAGAGEYGDRFRAVAHEIKRLAGRARTATDEVRNFIAKVQDSSRTTLSQAEEGQVEVLAVVQDNSSLRYNLQELELSAGQVGEAVSYLLTLAGQVSQRAEIIKKATQQQHSSNGQVILSAYSVEAIATQNVAATQLIATSSSQLESLTDQLSGVLSQVRLAA